MNVKEDEICPICLDKLDIEDLFAIVDFCNCKIKYHKECLIHTVKIIKKCPVCLKEIKSNNIKFNINVICDNDYLMIDNFKEESKNNCVIS